MTARLSHLHIVQSLELLEGGGLGAAALGLHRALLATGSRSTLTATYGRAPAHPASPGVHEFARTGPAKAYFSRDMFRQAASLVDAGPVLHEHGFYVAPNYLFGTLARKRALPVVLHPHGFLEPWILQRSRIKKTIAEWLFQGRSFREAKLWRALTTKEADQIRAHFPNARIVVIPNGVSLADFDEAASSGGVTPALPAKQKKNRMLLLSRLHPKKGFDLLVQAAAGLKKELAEWEVVIAGPDEGGYAQTLASAIARADLGSTIKIVPPVSGEAKRALLRSADLFVLPSYSEGFPFALLEAATCRLPIVLTDRCNFPELREAGAAWECAAEAASLIRALAAALNASESERRDRGQRGRALVEKSYQWPAIAAQLESACRPLFQH